MNIELNYKLIGQRLRAIRKSRGLTQEELAERADISPQHCSGAENGSAKISLPALIRVCNALDATPDEILMDSVKKPSPMMVQKDIANVFADCTADEVFLMLSQARSLKEALRAVHLKKDKQC